MVFLLLTAAPGAAIIQEEPSPATAMPSIDIRTTETSTSVFADGHLLLELKDNRHVRFRASAENDHWVGTSSHPSDLGWAYQDFKGLVEQQVEHEVLPGGFILKITGKKPGTDLDVEIQLQGDWDGERNFVITQSARLSGLLEQWYQNSRWAKARFERDPSIRPPIEASDYHLGRMSTLDRIFNRTAAPDLYEGVAYSEDGDNWTLIPKLPVAYPVNKSDHIYDFFLPRGGKIAYLDAEEGGWLVDFLHASVPEMRVELCWSWYDIHNVLEEAIPPRHSQEEFEVFYSWRFTAVTSERAGAILDRAVTAPWREGEKYALPAVSWHNRFDRRFQSDRWEFPWWRSSVQATWDRTTGFDDKSSLKIESDGTRPVAWYTFTWLYPFTWEPFGGAGTGPGSEELSQLPGEFDLSPFAGKEYRLTAMVRTEDCDGEVAIAVAQWSGQPIWLYSDRFSPARSEADAEKLAWNRSRSLTGTNGWTELSLTFTMDHFYRYLVLEQRGAGRAWFDNVVVEEVSATEAGG